MLLHLFLLIGQNMKDKILTFFKRYIITCLEGLKREIEYS